MINYLLTLLRKCVTITPYKWETIPQFETQEKEIEMTQNDMIVNTFRDYLRFLAADCSGATKTEIAENFKRARVVRVLARESGILANLDRAIKHDSMTNRVFVKSDFKSGAFINA
jgi:hypothetical protein